MSPEYTASLLGLALGVTHAFEPDHLAAMGTLVPQSRGPSHASRMGAIWGAGHGAALLFLGLVLHLMRAEMPDSFGVALELLVGVMLLVLGIKSIRRARGDVRHSSVVKEASGWRPFFVGLTHGAAGTGALIVLAAGSSVPAQSGWAFWVCFGAGAALGMSAVSGLMSVPLKWLPRESSLLKWSHAAAGSISIVVGVWWSGSFLIDLL